MPGRKALAPEVHRAKGSYKKDPQRENKAAPKADGKKPVAPDYFNDEEKGKWDELCEDLSTMGVISSECRELLISYCTAFGAWMEIRRKIAKEGSLLYGKRHPLSTDLHKYREQLNKLLPEFGLTPASRGKLVSMKLDENEDPFASILSRLTGEN